MKTIWYYNLCTITNQKAYDFVKDKLVKKNYFKINCNNTSLLFCS